MSLASSTILPSATFPSGLPLSELVTNLGPALLRVRVGADRDPRVHGVSYYDADAGEQVAPGHLLLLTSPSAMGPAQLERAIRSAAEQGLSAVVCKSVPDEAGPLAAAAAAHRIPLLGLDQSLSWRQFDALVSRLLGEHDSGLHLAPSAGDRLFSLANTIASTFRGSVAIEDHRRNVLAYSAMPEQLIDDLRANGILYRRAPDTPVNEIRYRQVFTETGVTRFPDYGPEVPRAAIAIRAGSIPLGSIWAIDPEGSDLSVPLSAEKVEVLEQGAILAAGYLVDAWRSENSADRPREESFKRLISGTAHENELTALGLRPKQEVLLAAVRSREGAHGPAEQNELRFAVHRHLSVYFPGSITISQHGVVLCLLPTGSTTEATRVFEQLLPELLRSSGQACAVGIGEPRRFSGSLTVQHDEAVGILECARERGLATATLAEVRPQLLLRACQRALTGQGRLVDPRLAALLDGAGERDAEARATLLVWCEEQGNAGRVAARLNLHEQTVRYRIRQLRERVELFPADPDELLALWLWLRLRDPAPAP